MELILGHVSLSYTFMFDLIERFVLEVSCVGITGLLVSLYSSDERIMQLVKILWWSNKVEFKLRLEVLEHFRVGYNINKENLAVGELIRFEIDNVPSEKHWLT